jgi:hypothetical protein
MGETGYSTGSADGAGYLKGFVYNEDVKRERSGRIGSIMSRSMWTGSS